MSLFLRYTNHLGNAQSGDEKKKRGKNKKTTPTYTLFTTPTYTLSSDMDFHVVL